MTSVQKTQQMLQQVGFPIVDDGSSGPLTVQAITWFQESWTGENLAVDGVWGPHTEAAVTACIGASGRISDHFSLHEFACPHCRWPRANRTLVRRLEDLRSAHYSNAGLSIVSGYRCVKHNTDIGGAKDSQHLKGRAADIPPHGNNGKLVTVEQVAKLQLFGGLEYQPLHSGRGCTHVDVRAGGDPSHPAIFAWGV
jgi:hypothetical protein